MRKLQAIIIVLSICLGVICPADETSGCLRSSLTIEELVNSYKFSFDILQKEGDSYLGYIANDHGVWSSGFSGEMVDLFIFRIDKTNKEKWDIYLQRSGFHFDEEKKYRDWFFPACYKTSLTKQDILDNLGKVTKLAELRSDTAVSYPSNCTAIVITNNLRIRSHPNLSSESKTIGMLKKFERISLYEETEKRDEIDGLKAPWYKIKMGEIVGWVYGGYVKIYFYDEDVAAIKRAFSD